jgi:uncharacterized membrane protein YagU involved in acid resistance
MFYTATMPMEKRMKIFRGEAIGCLNREYGDILLFNISVHQHFTWQYHAELPSTALMHFQMSIIINLYYCIRAYALLIIKKKLYITVFKF